jgi:hypothetical protein
LRDEAFEIKISRYYNITFWNLGFFSTNLLNNFVVATDDEHDLHKYSSIKKLARAVDVMKFDDDNINWNDFKHTILYEDATGKVKNCIKDQAELGNSLSDYEVMDCVYEVYHIHETTNHN